MKTNFKAIFNLRSKHRTLPCKLTGLSILCFTFFIGILTCPLAEADYNIYLKNGQIIKGVDYVIQEAGKVKISKYGITLELHETSVIKIEEYDIYEPIEKETVEKTKIQVKEEQPATLGHDEKKLKAEKLEKLRKLNQAENQYRSVLNKLKEIDALEKKDKELQKETRKKWSPRKARIAEKEKSGVDKKLESLSAEKDSLLRQKKELESEIRTLR